MIFLVFRSIYVSRPRIYRIFCAQTKVHQILVLLDIKFSTLDPLGAEIQSSQENETDNFGSHIFIQTRSLIQYHNFNNLVKSGFPGTFLERSGNLLRPTALAGGPSTVGEVDFFRKKYFHKLSKSGVQSPSDRRERSV